MHCVFQLTNSAANKQLKLKLDVVTVEYEKNPINILERLDRILSHRPQLVYTKNKAWQTRNGFELLKRFEQLTRKTNRHTNLQRLYNFRTGQGCCAFLLHRRYFIESLVCEYGRCQSMEHILQECNIHRLSRDFELNGLTDNARSCFESLSV